MRSGLPITLGLVGALAAAAALRRRGSRSEEEVCDGLYVHITPLKNAESVLRHGLEPFEVRAARQEPDLQGPSRPFVQAQRSTLGITGWSRGKVFFGQGDDIALAWAIMVWNNTGEAEFAAFTLKDGSPVEAHLREDPRGSKDVGCSFYVEGTVPASELIRDTRIERMIRRTLAEIAENE